MLSSQYSFLNVLVSYCYQIFLFSSFSSLLVLIFVTCALCTFSFMKYILHIVSVPFLTCFNTISSLNYFLPVNYINLLRIFMTLCKLQQKDGEINSKSLTCSQTFVIPRVLLQTIDGFKVDDRRLGPPTLFITCSMAKWFSQPFIQYLRQVNSNIVGVDK